MVHDEDQRHWSALSAIFNAMMGCLGQCVGRVVAFMAIAGREVQRPKSKSNSTGQISSKGPYEASLALESIAL
jgi:hypothetical protein